MKKKIFVVLMCLTALFSGCGNSAKTIEGDVTVKESGVNSGTEETPGAGQEMSGTPEGTSGVRRWRYSCELQRLCLYL